MPSRYQLAIVMTLIALGVLFAVPNAATAEPGIAPGQEHASPDSQVQVVEVQLPSPLGATNLVVLGSLKRLGEDTVDELHVVWQATHQGWLTTWSLQLVGSAERDATPLSSVWPKPGHVYTARLDLVPQMQAMSVYLYNETEDVPVYTGLIHLPEGNWHLIEPADALPNRGVDVIRAHTSTGPDPGPARLHGLPASLQQRLNLSVHTVSDARPVQSVLPDEPVVASFAWPSTPVPGVVEFVVETADGASVALGSSPWSETPVTQPLDVLRELKPGQHRLRVEYVFGPVREVLGSRELQVYAGGLNVEVRSLRLPNSYSLINKGIDWSFHPLDVVEGTLLVEGQGSPAGKIFIEAWQSASPGSAERNTLVSSTALDLPPGGRGNVRFTLELPIEAAPTEILVRPESDDVAITGDTAFSLRPAPVQWDVPGGTGPRAIAMLPEVPGVTHHTIYQATPSWGTFSHHAQIFYHAGTYYASWSNHATDEDAPGQWISYAISVNGEDWSAIRELFPPNDHSGSSGQDGLYLTAQRHSYQTGFVAVDDRVYAIASVIEWTSGSRRKLAEVAREVGTDGSLGPIFWLTGDPPAPTPGFPTYPSAADAAFAELAAKIIAAAEPITWRGYAFAAADGHGIVELTSYQRPDGVGVLLGRDADGSGYMYAALGDPATRTWDSMVRVNIPDSPSLADTGILPDGRAYLIHNPARARDPLVISVSDDGVRFDRAWIIRAGAPALSFQGMWKTRGYQYPSSIIADGAIWVIYSDGKENVHVSKIPLAALGE